MKKLTAYLAMALMIPLLSGCASIFSQSNYVVYIQSNPEDAFITITNRSGATIYDGNTPANVVLPASDGYFRGAFYYATISFDGYEDNVIPIKASIDGWYWANIFIGGPIGFLIIDPLTGAMFEIDQTYYSVTLREEGLAQPAPTGRTMYILNYHELSNKTKSRLINAGNGND